MSKNRTMVPKQITTDLDYFRRTNKALRYTTKERQDFFKESWSLIKDEYLAGASNDALADRLNSIGHQTHTGNPLVNADISRIANWHGYGKITGRSRTSQKRSKTAVKTHAKQIIPSLMSQVLAAPAPESQLFAAAERVMASKELDTKTKLKVLGVLGK